MINYLKEYVDEDTIIEMLERYDPAFISQFEIYKEDTIKIIEFMKQAGITVIEGLLIYMPSVFMMNYDEFINKVSKLDLPELVKNVNNDYVAMDDIFE